MILLSFESVPVVSGSDGVVLPVDVPQVDDLGGGVSGEVLASVVVPVLDDWPVSRFCRMVIDRADIVGFSYRENFEVLEPPVPQAAPIWKLIESEASLDRAHAADLPVRVAHVVVYDVVLSSGLVRPTSLFFSPAAMVLWAESLFDVSVLESDGDDVYWLPGEKQALVIADEEAARVRAGGKG